jgi:hypothetical protein
MDLEDRIAQAADEASAPWSTWRGHRVLALDGTALSMEDNPELKSEFGVPNTKHGLGRYPLVRMTVAMLGGTMAIVDYELGPYRSAENAMAMKMLPRYRRGDLVLADRRFAGANYYAAYQRRGVDYEPLRLSFTAAVCQVASTSLRMSTAPAWQLPALYELMLKNIALAVVPDRPNRNEPRAG